MIYVYIFILMAFSWGLSFITEYLPKRTLKMIMWGMIALMVVVAATKPETSADYSNYYRMFLDYDEPEVMLLTEPTYIFISFVITKLGGSFSVLLWIFALISVPLKIYAFKRLSSYNVLFAGMPIYIAFFFPLHDCEQIRIAAAMAFIIMAYVFRVEQRHWGLWVSFWLIGTLFHYSAAVAIVPMILYSSKSYSWYWRMAMMGGVLLGVVIWILKINIITMIPIPAIQAKIALYELTTATGNQVDSIMLYHPTALARYITFFYVLYFYDTIRTYVKGLNIILISETLGLFAWGGLCGMPAFAYRISELFEVTEIILFGSMIYTMRPSWVARGYILLVTMYIFFLAINANQFNV